MKRFVKFMAVFLLCVICATLPCSAITIPNGYMYDEDNKSYHAPDAYTVENVIYGEDITENSFVDPQDLYVSDSSIYIADTGNNRIVITDLNFNLVDIIDYVVEGEEQSELSEPEGVFYGADGLLYICDTDNFRVIAIDSERNVIRKIEGKDLVAVNESIKFKPSKVAVDKDSTVYIVAPDIYQGIIQYNENNEFMGFFAPNEVKITLGVRLSAMWKDIFSAEQQDKMEKNLPLPYNNIFIGKDGYIYTTAAKVEVGDEIKCLNALGNNILRTPQTVRGNVTFGDLETSYENGNLISSAFVDINTDNNGIFCVIDSTRGRIFQYDRECNMICIFGGKGSKNGEFKKPVAIEKIENSYIVLDADNRNIIVFEPTEYINKVHNALKKYNNGLYSESVSEWKEILKLNSNYIIAFKSIGRAYLQEGDYKLSMQMLEKGNDAYFYSMALKEYRKEYVRENLVWILPVAIVIIAVLIIGVKYTRKWLLKK